MGWLVIVYMKSRWYRLHFNGSPFDMRNVSSYLNIEKKIVSSFKAHTFSWGYVFDMCRYQYKTSLMYVNQCPINGCSTLKLFLFNLNGFAFICEIQYIINWHTVIHFLSCSCKYIYTSTIVRCIVVIVLCRIEAYAMLIVK